jgi:hypothetical protein
MIVLIKNDDLLGPFNVLRLYASTPSHQPEVSTSHGQDRLSQSMCYSLI